ncbi:hypothetical protein BP5796_10417 [Coleophoma crateriformis]|uniref:Uncharacterized protein n=1 Tax=Coleophoma crateriformis TaxID=565419 RepID=A0A3D8QQ35_9HELO|nr:hypothetical protein BP5796_10417 [Coleophoma crateriformis]
MAPDDHSTLEPPRTSVDDPGAHDLESEESSDDHFSDARSGLEHSALNSPIGIPVTRVEKVDGEPSYGEVPGTEAFKMRTGDAIPDEIALVTDVRDADLDTTYDDARPTTPGGRPIPITVVERVDETVSYGEVPGTAAHEMRAADAVPDMVVRGSAHNSRSSSISSPISRARAGSTPGDLPIPITRVEKVDDKPSFGEVPGTEAYEKRKEDAEPDVVDKVGDLPVSPTSPGVRRSSFLSHSRRKSSGASQRFRRASLAPSINNDYNEEEDGSEGGFGDDFDDFEEGADDADFDDFDDGFQEVELTSPPPQSIPLVPSFSVLDFSELDSPEAIGSATEPYLDALFPADTIDTSILPPLPKDGNPIFLTQRSASLWSQLVAPPPLQPPNWIRSRIRRLFLVSLGVPVDLDEILPASKQKKLILPSIHLNPSSGSPRTSTDSRSISRLKNEDGNASSTSLDSQGKPSKRRRGAPSTPDLDLVSARQICTITDEAMNGMTMEELQEHAKRLKGMQETAEEVLAFWTKMTDEKLGDREAFEGVIENLVKHARKTRK